MPSETSPANFTDHVVWGSASALAPPTANIVIITNHDKIKRLQYVLMRLAFGAIGKFVALRKRKAVCLDH